MARNAYSEHRTVTVNGVDVHLVERGEGALVLLLHGFPGSWYSWRHQVHALADAGFRVAAPDMRGYGRSSCPAEVERFSLPHLVGDVVGLIAALGERDAMVVGHDWGAPVAWATALMRPDLVRGVVGLSVPPYGPLLPIRRPAVPPVQALRQQFGDSFYMASFQEPGQAESALDGDVRASLLGMFAGTDSGNAREARFDDDHRPRDLVVPLPKWLSDDDLDAHAEALAQHGFRGGLNYYRNIDRNWELLAPWDGALITPPARYLIGDRDNVSAFLPVPGSLDELREIAPRATAIVTVADCGHWTQQEQPENVSRELIEFARGLE